MNVSGVYVSVYMMIFLVSSFFFTPHTLIHNNTHIHLTFLSHKTLNLRRAAGHFLHIHTLLYTPQRGAHIG